MAHKPRGASGCASVGTVWCISTRHWRRLATHFEREAIVYAGTTFGTRDPAYKRTPPLLPNLVRQTCFC